MKNFMLCIVLMFSMTSFGATKQIDVIYGEDNRKDVYETTSSLYLELAKSTAAMVDVRAIQPVSDTVYRVSGPTLAQRGICPKEKFSNQITAAMCSGFLVGPDLLATAGHCIQNMNDCRANVWVFDYNIKSPGQSQVTVPPSAVYGCKEIVKTVLDSSTMNDFALIRLSRVATDRKPLQFRKTGRPSVGADLVVIGHPTGLPTKIADNAKVRSHRNTHFVANLDTYGGNSGSAVFDARTGIVEGILVRGENDYVRDPSGCAVSNRCPDTGCRGEDVTYATELASLLK